MTLTRLLTRASLAVALLLALPLAPVAAAPPDPAAQPNADGFQAAAQEGEQIRNEWIVTLANRVNPRRAATDLTATYGGSAIRVYGHALLGFHYSGTSEQAAAMAADSQVTHVVPNERVQAHAESDPTGVRRIAADVARAQGNTGAGVRVAVLDTGMDLNHPDLVANIDPSLRKNCIGSGPPEDDNGHGTHVAGTIAAAMNGQQVIGVAAQATLVPIKVLDAQGSGSYASIICGIDYVTQNASLIGVANMSLGGGGSAGSCTDGSLRQAVCKSVAAGVFYAVAAGNDGIDAGGKVPARYPEVTTVSALDDRDGAPGGDSLASFSNDGDVIDVIAPGVYILSTLPGGNTGYYSGTSMSSPHVAGVAALIRAANPGLSPAAVRTTLQQTGECPNGSVAGGDASCNSQGSWSGDNDGQTEPLVNALNAVGSTPPPPPPPNTAPAVALTSPANGATVTGTTGIAINASDNEDANNSLAVQWRIGSGAWQPATFNSGAGSYTASWDTTNLTDGAVTVTARATDSANVTTTTAARSVTVDNVVSLPPPGQATMHIEQLHGNMRYRPGNYRTRINAEVHTATEAPVQGATITYDLSLSDGTVIQVLCVTDSSGVCAATEYTAVSPTSYASTGVTHPDYVYAPEDDH